MIEGIIYCFTNNINGKKYIGQTVREKERFKEHLINNKQRIDKAIRRYGIFNFEYTVLERISGASKDVHKALDFLEKQYIEEFDTMIPNGYNVLPGGSSKAQYLVYKKNRLKFAVVYIYKYIIRLFKRAIYKIKHFMC